MRKKLNLRKYFVPILSISFCFIVLGMFAFQEGEEFQVNTYTDLNQRDPAIAMDEKGNFVIAWESEDQDGSDYGIFAQRFNKQGIALGSEFQVNTYFNDSQRDPAIAMDKKGNFVITWTSQYQDGFSEGIFAKRFNKRGKALGSEFQVNTYINYSQYSPAIAMDEQGNFVITWACYYYIFGDITGTYRVYAQRFNKQGKALGSEFQVNNLKAHFFSITAIGMDKKGNFVITYRSSSEEILAQRFNKRGKALGSEFQVNTYTNGRQWEPAITMDKKGNFVITWTSQYQDGSSDGIFAQRCNKRGKALGLEFQVNTYADAEQWNPEIAMDEQGNFIITWDGPGEGSGGWSPGIFAQRFNKQGIALGSEFQANTYTDGYQWEPTIAMDKKGNFVITWESDGQDSSEFGIFAKMFKK